ncbi:NAD-dependent epimerase/dehydratase family protein [Leptospira ognonensis]|uniref:NAD-dependent epimerase/dehydratase family protein n=1 Tax=Leptospira ognonensis TaxID=2484945 RepID=A0A4R9K4Y9_9LEPT|nr:GDP-mannose 4,6-dehydratase [Leptospira ognonensis]TGL60310.1 NAD-dependent epimerase/dehydratase family protein [Leptospira ognonensis]
MQKFRALVTGGTGFVGKYLVSLLNEKGNFEIVLLKSDIREKEAISSEIKSVKPDFLFHLAAQPFVPKAMEDPWDTEETNVKGTLNILESIHRLAQPVKMVYVSTADVYGRQDFSTLPYNENLIPNPLNPYSGSKLAAESYCRQYAAYNDKLSIVIARPFNHIGVGQRPEFVIPNFCNQIIQAELTGSDFISVGDLNPTRDFSNVKDIVNGYLILAEYGKAGEIYNLCSGKEVSIRYLVETLIHLSGKNIKCKVDPARIRSAETSRVFGDNLKMISLGWKPQISIEETLKEIYFSIKKNYL